MSDGPIQHDVDMEAYDAEMLAAGFEFTDDEPEDDDEVELTFIGMVETPDIDARYPRKLSGRELEATLGGPLDTTRRGLVDNTVPTPRLYMSLIQLGVVEQARRQQRRALVLSAASFVIACVAVVVSFWT